MKKSILIMAGFAAIAVLICIGCDNGGAGAEQGDADVGGFLELFHGNGRGVSTFTDSRDGKKYRKVTIGNQVWMAENLHYNVPGSKCYGEDGKVDSWDDNIGDYNYITLTNSEIQENCNRYGRLYSWTTAMDLHNLHDYDSSTLSLIQTPHQGVCPDGWHIPSETDWERLIHAVGDPSQAGVRLRSKTGWNYNNYGTDNYGFSALPGGYGVYDEYYYLATDNLYDGIGSSGYWWGATALRLGSNSICFPRFGIFYDIDFIGLTYVNSGNIVYLFSVRCVEDG